MKFILSTMIGFSVMAAPVKKPYPKPHLGVDPVCANPRFPAALKKAHHCDVKQAKKKGA